MRNSIIKKDHKIKLELTLLTLKEGKQFVVFSPALNLSSYGDTEKEASEMFAENLKIFLSETRRKGTLDSLLLEYGWSLTKKPEPIYSPPSIEPFLLNKLSSYTNMIKETVCIPA